VPQSSGKSAAVLPGQSSQRPQVFPQASFFTQRGQAPSSSIFSTDQLLAV
jgi:hypothetical protein